MSTPAERVAAFLDARARMGGPVHPELVYTLFVAGERHDLTVADLRALIAAEVDGYHQGYVDADNGQPHRYEEPW